MILSVSVIENYFDKFNREFFNGELVRNFPCKISKAIGKGGSVRSIRNTTTVKQFVISERFAVDTTTIEDIIIHEMIHVYIIQKNMRDYSSHGRNFISKADQINITYKRNVPIFTTHEDTKTTVVIKKVGIINVIGKGIVTFNPKMDIQSIKDAYELRGAKIEIGFIEHPIMEKYTMFQAKSVLNFSKYYRYNEKINETIIPNTKFGY